MKYHRQSIRLKGFDYSNNGYYFVTICVQNKLKLFWNKFDANQKGGHIGPPVHGNQKNPPVHKNQEIELNDIGQMIDYWWNEIPNHFKNVLIDEFVIMPDHIHGILIIKNDGQKNSKNKGRTHRSARTRNQENQEIVGVDRCVDPNNGGPKFGNIIQWFKTMVTNNYLREIKNNNWPKFEKRIWQRNYFERIIRNEKEYLKIKQYIKDNPKNWEKD